MSCIQNSKNLKLPTQGKASTSKNIVNLEQYLNLTKTVAFRELFCNMLEHDEFGVNWIYREYPVPYKSNVFEIMDCRNIHTLQSNPIPLKYGTILDPGFRYPDQDELDHPMVPILFGFPIRIKPSGHKIGTGINMDDLIQFCKDHGVSAQYYKKHNLIVPGLRKNRVIARKVHKKEKMHVVIYWDQHYACDLFVRMYGGIKGYWKSFFSSWGYRNYYDTHVMPPNKILQLYIFLDGALELEEISQEWTRFVEFVKKFRVHGRIGK